MLRQSPSQTRRQPPGAGQRVTVRSDRSQFARFEETVDGGVRRSHACPFPMPASRHGIRNCRTGWACRRVVPSPRSSNHRVSSATSSGISSQVKVCTILSSETEWKQPRKRYSPLSSRETYRQLPPLRTSQSMIVDGWVRTDPADEQFGIGVRLQQLRRCAAEVAGDTDNRDLRVRFDSCLRIAGGGGHENALLVPRRRSARVAFGGGVRVVVDAVHLVEQGIEAHESLLRLPAIPLDPLGRGRMPPLPVNRPPLSLPGPRDQSRVLEHLQMFGNGLQTDVVRLRDLADRRIGDRQPGDDVAPGWGSARVRRTPSSWSAILRFLCQPSSTLRLNEVNTPCPSLSTTWLGTTRTLFPRLARRC